MTTVALKASEILKISLTKPEMLFEKPELVAEQFKTLAKKWHPDLCTSPEASKVFAHINVLHQKAVEKIKNNSWGFASVLTIETTPSHVKMFNYHATILFELGEIYICDKVVVYAVQRQYDDLVRQFVSTTAFRFANDDMQKEMIKFLPQNLHKYENKDRTFLVVDRVGDTIRLADLIAAKKKLDPRHVAWIMSRMYGLACYLDYANIRHFDFTPESFYIEPETHAGSLVGGWFYAGVKDKPNLAAPQRVFDTVANIKEIHPNAAHLLMIKQAGRKMLGVSTIAQLRMDKDVPKAMFNWLASPAGTKPVEEYQKWLACAVESFGARRFTELSIKSSEVYQ